MLLLPPASANVSFILICDMAMFPNAILESPEKSIAPSYRVLEYTPCRALLSLLHELADKRHTLSSLILADLANAARGGAQLKGAHQ